jgi:pimeloyl-ACP methyl ester carboxylesterase
VDTPGHVFMVPREGGMMANCANPTSLPRWLTEADVEVYVEQFARTGYRGALNWYRNIDRNWQLLAPFAGLKITVPALLIAGDRDRALAFCGLDQVIANLPRSVPKLQKTLILPGCGHWTQHRFEVSFESVKGFVVERRVRRHPGHQIH